MEPDIDLVFGDDDGLCDGFHDGAFVLLGQGRPAGVEVPDLLEDLLAGESVDAQNVQGGLFGRDRIVKLVEALFKRLIAAPEALGRELAVDIGAVHLIHLPLHGLPFTLQEGDLLGSLLHGGVLVFPIPADLLFREEEAL